MSVSLGQWNEEITCRTQFHLSGRRKILQNRPKWFTYCVSVALRGCYFSLSHFPSWSREDMFHGVNLWNKKLLEILQVVHLSTHWKWKSLSCLWHDCSPPGFSVLGILQARILECVLIPFFRGSFRPREWTQVSWILYCLNNESLFPLVNTQFSFQSQGKAMPKEAQTTAQLHSSHTLVK